MEVTLPSEPEKRREEEKRERKKEGGGSGVEEEREGKGKSMDAKILRCEHNAYTHTHTKRTQAHQNYISLSMYLIKR